MAARKFTAEYIREAILSGEIPCERGEVLNFPASFVNSCTDLDFIDRIIHQMNCKDFDMFSQFTPEEKQRIGDAARIASRQTKEPK